MFVSLHAVCLMNQQNGKEVMRQQAGQPFALVIGALDSMGSSVAFTEESWEATRRHLRLEVAADGADVTDTSELSLQNSSIEGE